MLLSSWSIRLYITAWHFETGGRASLHWATEWKIPVKLKEDMLLSWKLFVEETLAATIGGTGEFSPNASNGPHVCNKNNACVRPPVRERHCGQSECIYFSLLFMFVTTCLKVFTIVSVWVDKQCVCTSSGLLSTWPSGPVIPICSMRACSCWTNTQKVGR